MRILKEKRLYFFYIFLLLGVCISFVFTNISYDAEYQLAMAYRLIKGDMFIVEMWEPHQTSAFLCAILMKIYLLITGTTTGIVLFIQIMGLMIRVGICIWLIKVIKERSGKIPAFIVGMIYFLLSPKEVLVPEFSNMQIWFCTIMCLCLLHYLKNARILWLVGAAVSLCLSVFSYPSAILCYFAVVFILCRYSNMWKRDICIFTTTCAVIGGSFVIYLFCNIGWDTIFQSLECALGVEPSHTVSMGEKFIAHVLNLVKIVGMLFLVSIIGLLPEGIRLFIAKKDKKPFNPENWLVASWFVLMLFFLLNILSVRNRGGYGIPCVVVLILGFTKRNLLTIAEKRMYDTAISICLMNLFATLVLSDHTFLQAIPYMLIGICISIVPIYHWFKQMNKSDLKKAVAGCFHVWMLLIIFRAAFIHIPIFGRSQICSLFDDLALIRSGPALGIVTDEAGAARQRDSYKEWGQYVKPGDTIWILGEPVDTLGYLYVDVEIGAPTVMSTPTYNENLLYYWEINPEKYPDVIILASSFGDLSWELLRNEWLLNWLENEYCADTVTDGFYWRYYERRR